jgi:hypothetical protein
MGSFGICVFRPLYCKPGAGLAVVGRPILAAAAFQAAQDRSKPASSKVPHVSRGILPARTVRAHMVKYLMGLLLAIGVVFAQDAPKPPAPAQSKAQTPAKSEPEKDAKKRLGLIATRAIANFRSADSIEANLGARGETIHPQLAALRLRIEAALDEAQTAVDHGQSADANKALDNAQALLDRFAQRLGGA